MGIFQKARYDRDREKTERQYAEWRAANPPPPEPPLTRILAPPRQPAAFIETMFIAGPNAAGLIRLLDFGRPRQ
jgi:hypothetical protein